MKNEEKIELIKELLCVARKNEHVEGMVLLEEALESAVSALKEQEGWISAFERLPEYGIPVLAQTVYGNMLVSLIIKDTGEWFDDCIVAWRPLPEPYQEDKA